jgi:hypothetical protein
VDTRAEILPDLPKGKQSLFRSMRDAGISAAQSQRNVAWLNVATDGTPVLNAWHEDIEPRNGYLVAVVDARRWRTKPKTEGKRLAVVSALERLHGQSIRVIVLESKPNKPRHYGTHFDDLALWLVEDTGSEFLLWRGRPALDVTDAIPANPVAFGALDPARRERISTSIERLNRVRLLTLQRARNRCELADCSDHSDFSTPDVHHITWLGHGGSDHTDNTIALCPACHARVHRGTARVVAAMNQKIQLVRDSRRSVVALSQE